MENKTKAILYAIGFIIFLLIDIPVLKYVEQYVKQEIYLVMVCLWAIGILNGILFMYVLRKIGELSPKSTP